MGWVHSSKYVKPYPSHKVYKAAPQGSAAPFFKSTKRPNFHEQILRGTRAAAAGNKQAQMGIVRLGMVTYMSQDSRATEQVMVGNAVRKGYIQRYNRRKYQF